METSTNEYVQLYNSVTVNAIKMLKNIKANLRLYLFFKGQVSKESDMTE